MWLWEHGGGTGGLGWLGAQRGEEELEEKERKKAMEVNSGKDKVFLLILEILDHFQSLLKILLFGAWDDAKILFVKKTAGIWKKCKGCSNS